MFCKKKFFEIFEKTFFLFGDEKKQQKVKYSKKRRVNIRVAE
jgi:hypothetical protein